MKKTKRIETLLSVEIFHLKSYLVARNSVDLIAAEMARSERLVILETV